ncbi:hypothetical protein C8Q79DRAFT_926208 [Trametes meyenii]|nr:hypothetical protein C8Q79DRAFT_926208 [Trametes meyenii]
MPSPNNNTTLLAKQKGLTTAIVEGNMPVTAVLYDVLIPPQTPLHISQKASIRSLTPCNDLFPEDEEPHPRYIAYKTEISGTIIGIRNYGARTTELILKNENMPADVPYAYITIQHIDNYTVQLDIWRRAFRTLIHPLLPLGRFIPLEPNAIVYMSDRTADPMKNNADAPER